MVSIRGKKQVALDNIADQVTTLAEGLIGIRRGIHQARRQWNRENPYSKNRALWVSRFNYRCIMWMFSEDNIQKYFKESRVFNRPETAVDDYIQFHAEKINRLLRDFPSPARRIVNIVIANHCSKAYQEKYLAEMQRASMLKMLRVEQVNLSKKSQSFVARIFGFTGGYRLRMSMLKYLSDMLNKININVFGANPKLKNDFSDFQALYKELERIAQQYRNPLYRFLKIKPDWMKQLDKMKSALEAAVAKVETRACSGTTRFSKGARVAKNATTQPATKSVFSEAVTARLEANRAVPGIRTAVSAQERRAAIVKPRGDNRYAVWASRRSSHACAQEAVSEVNPVPQLVSP